MVYNINKDTTSNQDLAESCRLHKINTLVTVGKQAYIGAHWFVFLLHMDIGNQRYGDTSSVHQTNLPTLKSYWVNYNFSETERQHIWKKTTGGQQEALTSLTADFHVFCSFLQLELL